MPKPTIALLPDKRPTVIVVGTSVRKPAEVLRHYLAGLAQQELPPNTVLKPVFVADHMDAEAEHVLRDWAQGMQGDILQGLPAQGPDFSDVHPDSHQWSQSAMARVGANKDMILQRARELNADYVWFCDADLICDRTTLKSMLAVNQPIVSAVYWTRWSAREVETRKIHAAPQVWLKHPYELAGMGYSEAEFRTRLANRQLTKVLGYGACTLLNRRAIGAGVSFAYLPDVSQQGLMAGEDRHFCVRAQRLHLEAYADAWPDIFHIYHLPADLAKARAYHTRLEIAHPDTPQFGDLVNFTIQALEPIPWSGGGWTAIPPQHIRGRLGALPLLVELEEALYTLKRGDFADVAVHFPVSYEVPYYAGKRRLMRLTLHDCKPNGFAPVLEDEMLMGSNGGGAFRTVDYTTRQLDAIREDAHVTA